MFEQDYVMRTIEDLARGLMKLLFGIDSAAPMAEPLLETEERGMLLSVFDMADLGRINEAEELLFERAETGDRADLLTALRFYSYLNRKTDRFLEENGFSRAEIAQGIRDITAKYGVSGLDGVLFK